MYYKLGNFVLLQIRKKVVANWLGLHYYKLGQMLLQIGVAITYQGNRYYK